MYWEEIHVVQVADKGPVSRNYREPLQLNQETITQLKTWPRDMNRYFTKEDVRTADQQMKRHLALSVREKCKCKLKPKGDTTTHPPE